MSVDIKNNVEKDATLSKSPGGHAISRQKRLELPVMSYLLIDFFHIGMPVVRTDGRANGYVINKISRMDGLPNFLRYGARLPRASRARGAPLKNTKITP